MPFFRAVGLSLSLFPALFAQPYKLEPLAVVAGWSVSAASAINNRGAIVGSYRARPWGRTLGFKRDVNGVFEFPIVSPDSGQYTFPLGINDYGVIVGYYYDPAFIRHGFVLTGGPHGTFTTHGQLVGGINDRGDFAGTDEQGGFLSVDGTITRFTLSEGPPTLWGIAWDRTVIGSSFDGNITMGIIRGPAGRLLRFRIANAVTTVPFGINNEAGKIVGYYQDLSGVHGFVYDYVADLAAAIDGATATAVRTVPVQTIDYPGAPWTYVADINAKGTIVGYTSSGISFTGTQQP